MPRNITVYLQDEIAAEMDKFAEVSWSEVCRDAILAYVSKRAKGFQPSSVRVTLEDAIAADWYGATRLQMQFNILNSSDYEIILDRARFNLNINAGSKIFSFPPQMYLEPLRLGKGMGGSFQIPARL